MAVSSSHHALARSTDYLYGPGSGGALRQLTDNSTLSPRVTNQRYFV